MKENKNIFVFDVESTSLYGIGFAVGAIVLTRTGEEVDRFELKSKEEEALAGEWVRENVIPHLQDMPTCDTARELRDSFYAFYMKHKDAAEIWCDCSYPVETNFLNAVVNDDIKNREWTMPYPLKDISTIVDINIDRAVECGISGLKKHNPLDDARASAAFLLRNFRS